MDSDLMSTTTDIDKIIKYFSVDVLIKFQEYVVKRFKMPSALWIVDEDNEIKKITSQQRRKYYPDLCKIILNECLDDNGNPICLACEKVNVERYIRNSSHQNDYDIIQCPLGIKRIYMPITIDNTTVGLLTVGKFISSPHDTHDIYCKIANNEHINKQSTATKDKINECVGKISYTHQEILKRKIKDLVKLKPLLCSYYKNMSPSSEYFQNLIFLDYINKECEDVYITPEELWVRSRTIFQRVIDFFGLSTIHVYYTNSNNHELFNKYVSVPDSDSGVHLFSFQSYKEFETVLNSKETTLPTGTSLLSWMDGRTSSYFGSDNVRLYAHKIFSSKFILIAVGLAPGCFPDECSWIIIKSIIHKYVLYVKKTLSSEYLDEIMLDTGHLIGRSMRSIEKGYNVLKKIITKNKTALTFEDADELIRGGLLRIDIISKNYAAFKDTRLVELTSKMKSKFKDINVSTVITELKGAFKFTTDSESKEIIIFDEGNGVSVHNDRNVFKVIAMNVLDNAVKFSYKRTKIYVKIIDADHYVYIFVEDLGLGISHDELNLVFERNFKASYNDISKKHKGCGMGLAACRRYIDIYFPSGEISLESKEAHTAERRFPGDNFLTTVTIKLPKKVC